jgi:hypothetical protein
LLNPFKTLNFSLLFLHQTHRNTQNSLLLLLLAHNRHQETHHHKIPKLSYQSPIRYTFLNIKPLFHEIIIIQASVLVFLDLRKRKSCDSLKAFVLFFQIWLFESLSIGFTVRSENGVDGRPDRYVGPSVAPVSTLHVSLLRFVIRSCFLFCFSTSISILSSVSSFRFYNITCHFVFNKVN